MNQMATGAPYTGVAVGGVAEATNLVPLKIGAELIRKQQKSETAMPNIVAQLSPEQVQTLEGYLTGRLDMGDAPRNKRIWRYARIDKSISTWQKLDPQNSERERIEDNTGKQSGIPFNLPVLASHLNDMTSYFTESLAPVSNPFFTSSGDGQSPKVIEKLNRDAIARNYYSELNLTVRSLLKYNIGGFVVEWDAGALGERKLTQPGNYWRHLDMYNTLWDPAIRNPQDVAAKGEWAATVTLTNRLELMRRSLSGEWFGLDKKLSTGIEGKQTSKYYREPQVSANLTDQGQDARTAPKDAATQGGMNWGAWGLGLASELGPEIDGWEKVEMYCWLVPAQFGLLTDAERTELEGMDREPEAYLELWRFTLIDRCLVDCKPVLTREQAVGGEIQEIPVYLTYLTQDQLKEAQRSFMELMRGFQRFASAMYSIYVEGMRKNVWGVIGLDPTMFDGTKLKQGDPVGVLESKQAGRDVRTGMTALNSAAGVENALQAVDGALNLKNQFFPSQALPSQVAGIDRAVKSQVTTVVHGAQRGLRLLLRILDSSLMLPTRMSAFRNLKKFEPEGIETVTDEAFAKMIGSGIESMESERVAEALQNLLFAIIQNQEAMTVFDVPGMLTYLSRVLNLGTDLGQFARQPQPQAAPSPAAAPAPAPAA